ncbi:alpha/beta fold hydrolase [Sediminibacillus dalangtanensis]|uniref:Alpha/beta fold hydrolase n=1 Tax=Sediminibacillus dalangtanensis TaxID=2729421 RepID=A0ABX7VQY5_9BACI|nr:alpha/beta fold hydrolase [Sediminibacillus dalangtanensis]QTM98913.1 alpha/beta fold hydrolase [Sediminibacillus dalangtanensis]
MAANYRVMKDADAFYFAGNEIGVLVIHGFTGTTQSMRYIGEQFAAEGFTVLGPRLEGHGTDPEDMEASTYQDWIDNVEAGLATLKEECSKLFVAGLSMGGTLTLYLAEQHPEINGILPINAAVDIPEMAENYRKLSQTDTRFVNGIGSDIKRPGVKELAYEKTPVKSMGEIVTLTEMVKQNLSNITAPALIFSSNEDHVVPPENSKLIYDSVSSAEKTLFPLEASYHVATLDNDKEVIANKAIQFIKANC